MRQMQVFHFQRSIFNANEINMVKHSPQRGAEGWGLGGFMLFIFSTCGGTDTCSHGRGWWHQLLLLSSAHAGLLSAASLIRRNYSTRRKKLKIRHLDTAVHSCRAWEPVSESWCFWGSLPSALVSLQGHSSTGTLRSSPPVNGSMSIIMEFFLGTKGKWQTGSNLALKLLKTRRETPWYLKKIP